MPIKGVNGLPGAGKTLMICRELYLSRKRQAHRGEFREIASNTPLWFPWGPPVRAIQNLEEVYDLKKCDLFLDEVHLLWDSLGQMRSDLPFKIWCSQLRKRDVNLWWTSQAWESVHVELRRRTSYSYFVENRLNFGHFAVKYYFGIEPEPKNLAGGFWYIFNPMVASCYETDYEVGRSK